ncbi:NUDIX hydrolase [Chondromyces crocatus]|uniref:NUDIX hydrolase n=1 Tax=Chondromyces crocatus TaxID=52 RepID=UPI001FDFC2E5|nr:NUDIX hydrolase [Chondromyces crocatus]
MAHTAFTMVLADWVAVAATTEDGQILLVRQHRHGVDAVTLEVAGGCIDPGEEPEVAALRELREETGYAAEVVESLGWVHPNPAIQGNRCFLYLARGAKHVGPPAGDEHESVEPVLLAPEEIPAATRDGRISHVLAVIALDRALAWLSAHGQRPRP